MHNVQNISAVLFAPLPIILIIPFLGVALEVFNKCITRGKQNGYETVTLNYEFLDDTYADWSSGTEVNEGISKTVGEYLNVMIKEQTKTTFDKDLDKKENHPLALMVRPKIIHILVRAFY